MGVVYGQMGKIDSALNTYQEAIELGERNPQVIQRTIQLLFAKQRYDDAQSAASPVRGATSELFRRYESA